MEQNIQSQAPASYLECFGIIITKIMDPVGSKAPYYYNKGRILK